MDFEELLSHVGHDVVVVIYGDEDDPANVAIECETCGVVIADMCPGDFYAKHLAEEGEE